MLSVSVPWLFVILSLSAQLAGQASLAQEAITMEQAIALAERFVQENGYSSATAEDIKTQPQLESLEFSASVEKILEGRANTLQPKAIGAKAIPTGWGVAFDYFRPATEVCRVVTMQHDGSGIRMMHQDGNRVYWVGFQAE